MSEWQGYKEKTFEQLDREVEEAVKAERKRKIGGYVIFFAMLFYACPDAFLYWFRFATPHFPKYKTEKIIDVTQTPIQNNIKEKKGKYFKYNTLENRGSYSIEKMAEYSISGILVAKNFFFWGNYLPNGDRPFQSMALIDIGLIWGKLADKDIRKQYKFVSAKDARGARALYPRLKHMHSYPPIDWHRANSLLSHTHVIPANANIMHALMFAPKNKPLKMDGYLVDIYINGTAAVKTSLSRDDFNSTARGGGACETMYVERVQIGNKVYE